MDSPELLLQTYEQRLVERRWEAVADLIHEDAVFIFSEGTFRGKKEIGAAFTRTFQTIQDERYEMSDVEWILVAPGAAACIFRFHWRGIVAGEETSGGGRGTIMMRRTGAGWQIVHEHLGP
jgi:ketosteroid isomerase-like protein